MYRSITFFMKKLKLFLVGSVALMGTVVFFYSCSEELKDESCVCHSSHGLTKTINPSSFGASNCSDLEVVMEAQASDGITYSCS